MLYPLFLAVQCAVMDFRTFVRNSQGLHNTPYLSKVKWDMMTEKISETTLALVRIMFLLPKRLPKILDPTQYRPLLADEPEEESEKSKDVTNSPIPAGYSSPDRNARRTPVHSVIIVVEMMLILALAVALWNKRRPDCPINPVFPQVLYCMYPNILCGQYNNNSPVRDRSPCPRSFGIRTENLHDGSRTPQDYL